MAGAGFQVALKLLSDLLIPEGRIRFQLPRSVSLTVGTITAVVLDQALLDVLCAADV